MFLFFSSKKSGKGKRPGKGGNRFWKSIGLGFKTPRDAIEGLLLLYFTLILALLSLFENVVACFAFARLYYIFFFGLNILEREFVLNSTKTQCCSQFFFLIITRILLVLLPYRVAQSLYVTMDFHFLVCLVKLPMDARQYGWQILYLSIILFGVS